MEVANAAAIFLIDGRSVFGGFGGREGGGAVSMCCGEGKHLSFLTGWGQGGCGCNVALYPCPLKNDIQNSNSQNGEKYNDSLYNKVRSGNIHKTSTMPQSPL